jgi:hypothetical protein
MIFQYHRDVHRLPALLLCQTFFASKPVEGFRIDHSHVVLSFRFQHVKLHNLAVGIGCMVETVTGEYCVRAPK